MVEDILTTLLGNVGGLGKWLQALGVVVVINIVFDVIAFIYNRKRMQEVYKIKDDMNRIERKIDRILKQK
ncbi:hypothetical protein KW787_01020 [Candidatus Pacearchaeota archaeon]|nr:hypothetical protein [Candidatus Pacearchaeota archaeon]